MTLDEMKAQIAKLSAENAQLKSGLLAGGLGLKVSPKGAVSLTGVGKWPATFYAPTWQRILGHKKEILAFIEANKASLSWEKKTAKDDADSD